MNQAIFDETGAYRYRLSRSWLGGVGTVCFIMLNPSTADAEVDDPTIRRCIRFAQRWGFSRLEVVNLFAYRSTSPYQLLFAADPTGPETDRYIQEAAVAADRMVCAWGVVHRKLSSRADDVLRLVRPYRNLLCLGTTATGFPRHPLYMPYSKTLERYP